MSLQILYRPKSFKAFAGNDESKKSLQEILERKHPPSAFLIVGPSGCGKTTLGRIIAKALGCKKDDYKETNASSDRTLPAIRKLIDDMRYTPMSGKKKVVLMDECFAPDTKISTISDQIPISEIKIGDTIYNLNGIDTVEKVFKNKIPLNHVVRVNKSDDTYTFCSKNHEYYINGEWVFAKDLTNRFLACYNDVMLNTQSLYRGQEDGIKNLQMVQRGFLPEEKNKIILFQQMFSLLSRINKRKTKIIYDKMRILQRIICTENKKEQTILFKKLRFKMDAHPGSHKEKNIHPRKKDKCKERTPSFFKNRSCQRITSKIFGTYEEIQSFFQPKKYRKIQNYQKIKRYFTYLAWKTWGQWAINRSPEIAYDFVGVGSRSADKNSRPFTCRFKKGMVRQKEGSYQLQSGHRESGIKNSYRSGLQTTQRNQNQKERSKEGIFIKMERVESVEIYQRGNNDQSFESIIGDKERNQGYIEFYDLQIEKNPSYIANGNMVHNCHGLLSPTQEALLKALEEPPSHVHFILCTTNPEALKDTFKRRCHIYEVQPLNSNQMVKHLKLILKKEKVKNFKVEILEKIIELSNGSPGIALKYLDMVIDMTDPKEAINLLKSSGTSENDVIEICRALTDFRVNDKTRWGRVKKLLKNFKGDAESARRPILGYLNSCLLGNSEGINFALIMDEFKTNFYDSGKAGLSLACFKSCFISDED